MRACDVKHTFIHQSILSCISLKVLNREKNDTSLIKIGQEITTVLLFEVFNMTDIGAAILNI